MALSLPRAWRRPPHPLRTESSTPDRRRALRPSLMALEDRCVPSTLTVTSSADDVTQNHTLRYAVAHAQSGDTIQITAAVKGPIVLTHGDLVLNKDVTVLSVPSRTATISGGGTSRVFEIPAGAHVTLTNLEFTGGVGLADNPAGNAGYDGQAGAVLNLGTVVVNSCTFDGNSATYGGALNNQGNGTVNGGVFHDNFAYGNSGALDDIGTVSVHGTLFQSNTAESFGGAVNVFGGFVGFPGTTTLDGCTFLHNTSDFDAGGVQISATTATVTNCTFDGNTAQYGGGMATSGTTTITGGVFRNNTAYVGGGGIFTFSGSSTVASGVSFIGNTSYQFGGGVSNAGGLSVTAGTFAGNVAVNSNGGGIDTIGNIVLSGTAFSNNPAGGFGGGISNHPPGSVTIDAGTFTGNSAA